MRHDLPSGQQLLALKTAGHLAIEAVGGFEAASLVTGLSTGRLSEACALHNTDRWLRVDSAARLDCAAQRPLMASVLANLTGHQLMPLPQVMEGEAPRAVAEAFAEGARGAVTLMTAMADGELDERERAALDASLSELIRLAGRARALLAGPPLPIGQKVAKLRGAA